MTIDDSPAHTCRLTDSADLDPAQLSHLQAPNPPMKKTARSQSQLQVGLVRLQVDHPEFLPAELSIITRLAAAEPYTSLQLEAGLELPGRVVNERLQEIPGAVVELRGVGEGSGALRKTQATDDLGRFHFRGLPDTRFTIFVQTLVKGITWSGRATGLSPGETGIEIVVRS